jgi:hypothetical protein
MKHLKIYEGFGYQKSTYKKGDYVLVDAEAVFPSKKIKTQVGIISRAVGYIVHRGYVYEVKFLDDERNFVGIADDNIIRKLDDHEVSALKYNL